MSTSNQVSSIPTSNFAPIFRAACDEYKKLTGHDLDTHPFASELERCDSPGGILEVLRGEAQTLIKCRKRHEKLFACLSPIVNVMFTLSGTLGEGTGLACSPGKTIFTGIGVLFGAVKDVLGCYDRLVCLLERVQFFVERLRCYDDIPLRIAMVELLAKIMAQVITILALSTKEMKERQIKKFFKRLLGRTAVDDALLRLDNLTKEESLMTAATTLQLVNQVNKNVAAATKITQGFHDNMDRVETAARVVNRNVRRIRVGVDQMKQRQLRGELRKWLAPPNASINHNNARDTQHAGTARWFIEGTKFNDWKNDNTVLWIRGNPGCGKSVLCSAIIEDLKRAQEPENASTLIAYYYFDFKDTAKRDLRGLLSSLLMQLGSDSDQCLHVLSQLHMTCRDGSEQPSEESLAQCLKVILGQPEQLPIYIIVDALDECPNITGFPSARKKVLDFMTVLIGAKHPNLHLCITSRPEQDIQATLNSLTNAERRVSLHEEGGQREDINNYIRYFVQNTDPMQKWRDEDKELVINTLSERADGMFRWVYCQLDVLSRCFAPSIRKALNELPITLDETYERTLQGIAREKKQHAHRLFQCLVAAIRPLRVDELAEIFAVDFDPNSEPKLVEGWRPENPEEAVLSACSTLITIVGDEDSKIVQFSHFSVKEFLTSDRFQASELGKPLPLHIPLDAAHTVLTRACLTVLLQFDEKLDKQRVDMFPLAPYAAKHWVEHAKIENVASQSQDPMERLFNPKKPHLVAWTRIYNIDKGNEPSTNDLDDSAERPSPARATSLYYAALCGFAGVAEYLIAVHAEDVNVKCGHHGTPLHAASYEGNLDAARVLVDHNADVTMTNVQKRTALCSAYDGGHLDVMQMLLERGADVDERYAYSARLLHIAAHHGQVDVVELLLRNCANVDARDSVNQTPLHGASTNGHVNVVELLLDNGANVNAETTSHSTPLHGASESGHLEVVRTLLRRGADVHMRNRKNRSAFEVATTSGHSDVAKLLAEHGAENE